MNKRGPSDHPIRTDSFWLALILSLIWVAGLPGCGEVTGSKQEIEAPAAKTTGRLYVANGDGRLLAFDPPLEAKKNVEPIIPQGNISPSRRFPEGITSATGLFLDRTNDTLYVATTGQNAVLIYDNASQNPSNATRVIAGSNTGLNHPFAVTYDATRCALYVANKENSIVVFQRDCGQTSQLDGNIAPSRVLKGSNTLLDFPRALAIDTQRNILYISNMGSNSILVYEGASQASGDAAPTRTITSHTDASQTESMLNLPFGLFVDKDNDRLYVVKAGGNQPALFIYENASQKSGEIKPERVLTTRNTQLPPECNTFPPPTGFDSSICNTMQLTQPAGVDVEGDRIYVANNSNTNNTNQSGHNNADAAAVVVFNDVLFRCPLNELCSLSPDRRIGGGPTPTGPGTGLANPVGIAIDLERDFIYLSNPTANNILVFSLEGNMAPAMFNGGKETQLEQPTSFFYDKELDRLYIANFNSGILSPPQHQITVYDRVSEKSLFFNTPPDWSIDGGSTTRFPRGVYLDKTRNRLIILGAGSSTLAIYDLNAISGFPINAKDGPKGTIINLPTPPAGPDGPPPPGLIATKTVSAATAMAVDEKNGEVYLARSTGTGVIDKYNLADLDRANDSAVPRRRISGSNTGLNRPYGLFLDIFDDDDPASPGREREILYVTNTQALFGTAPNPNAILAFHNASGRGGAPSGTGNLCADTSCNTPPDRIIFSDANFASEDQLSTPTAPFVNSDADRLFLINRGTNALFIFENASSLNGAVEPDRKIAGTDTTLLFTSNGSGFDGNDVTGALFVDTRQGRERIFVGQPRNSSDPIFFFRGAFLVFSVEGNIPPGRIWSGSKTGSAIAIDISRDLLYIADQGNPAVTTDDNLSILTNASQVNVDRDTPTSMTIPQLNNPAGLFVDPDQDRLYLSNSGTDCSNPAIPCNTILVFDAASSLNNGAIPNQTLSSLPLNNPRGLVLDLDRKTLYVANAGGNSLLAFDLAAVEGQSGPLSLIPKVEIGGLLNQPVGVAIDSANDLLYILNQGTLEILVFDRVSTLSGSVSPSPIRIISGKGFMTKPSSLFLDPGNDLLYVADEGANAVYIYPKASNAQGEADHATLSGNNTGLNSPSALFVDTTK